MSLTRRGVLGATVGVTAAAARDGGSEAPERQRVVIAGAHPDDPETVAGGTARLLVERGHQVVFLYLTRGEAGIAGTAPAAAGRRREDEARAACALLGVEPVFAGHVDGATLTGPAQRAQLQKLMASLAPHVVFTHWPVDTHRDHRACTELLFDLWLSTRPAFSLYFHEGLTGQQTQTFAPDTFVDVTSVVELKRRAVECHRSQQPAELWAAHERMQRFRGAETWVSDAEAFVHHKNSAPWAPLAALAPRPR